MAIFVPRATPPQEESSPAKQQQGFFRRYFGSPGADETWRTVNECEPEPAQHHDDQTYTVQAMWGVAAAAALIFVLYIVSF